MIFLFHSLARLPLPVAHGIGYLLGWLFFLLPNPHRNISRVNLKYCYPELSRFARLNLLRKSLIETGKLMLETPTMWLGKSETILNRVKQVSGEDYLKKGMARGKGVILAIPHLGSWEMVGLYCSANYPMTSLYRPPRQQSLEETIRKGREVMGAKLVPTDAKGVRSLYKALSAGEVVAILPDQDPREEGGSFAPFYGIAANTMTLLPRLVARSGATVLMCFTERLSWGRGFHLHFFPAPDGIECEETSQSVVAVNQGVEQCVRMKPEQYQWCYKRFRTRPEGEKPFYQ